MSKSRSARRMSGHESATASAGAIVPASAASISVEEFSFDEASSVMDRRQIMDMVECWHNGRWYEPPITLDGLARAFRVSPHHSSAILLKRNLLVASFAPSAWLSRKAFAAAVQDYLVFGNCYFERRDSMLGTPLRLEHVPAKYTRRGVEPGTFFFVPGGKQETSFRPGHVCQLMQPDVNQELYGVPEYLSALQSALLNESATLFRRRYFINGSHAGFIMHLTGDFSEGDIAAMKTQLRASKGAGNFKNLMVHQPGGKEGTIKLVPIAEVGAKDEFMGIKNTTRDDVLAAHRVPPQLLGVIPANAGGFGDPGKATDMFFELEIEPMQSVFEEVNDWLGLPVIAFRERTSSARTPAG